MKEKKIFKIENEGAQKNPNRNYIEYYVNPEKQMVTAVLIGVRKEMKDMFEKKFANAGFSAYPNKWFLGRTSALYDAMKTIPDKIIASATCAPEDEFDVEFGCSIARMRLLQKLYFYRAKVASILSVNLSSLECLLNDYSDFCDGKYDILGDSIDDTIINYEHRN